MPLTSEDYERARRAGAESDARDFGQPVNIPGLTFSDDQTYQIVGEGNDTSGWAPRAWQWGNARNKPSQDTGQHGITAPMPDMGSYGMAGPSYPGSYLHNYLDQFYKTYNTPEKVRDSIVEDAAESGRASNRYWNSVANTSGESFSATNTMNAQMRDAQAYMGGGGYSPPAATFNPVGNYSRSGVAGGEWVMPNDPKEFDSRVGIQETRINQPDGRSDTYKPGVGYNGSIYSGDSIAQARKILESQQNGTFSPPSPRDYVQAQAAAGATAPNQIPLPGGGYAVAPKNPIPENAFRVITAPSGQVIGYSQKYDSPEAAQAASNAAKNAPKVAEAPKAAPTKPAA